MRLSHAVVLAGIALLLALPIPARSDNGLAAAADNSTDGPMVTIDIKNLQFVPAEITIAAGTTVKWVNLDPFDHDVTSGVSVIGRKTRGMQQTKFPDDKFASGLFGENKSFSVTFDSKGEYDYYCNIHPFMVAKVIVQ